MTTIEAADGHVTYTFSRAEVECAFKEGQPLSIRVPPSQAMVPLCNKIKDLQTALYFWLLPDVNSDSAASKRAAKDAALLAGFSDEPMEPDAYMLGWVRPVDIRPAEETHPFEMLKQRMHADSEYAWSWQCNVAMPIMDELPKNNDYRDRHKLANAAAARVMRHVFDIDVTGWPEWKGLADQWDAATREETTLFTDVLHTDQPRAIYKPYARTTFVKVALPEPSDAENAAVKAMVEPTPAKDREDAHEAMLHSLLKVLAFGADDPMVEDLRMNTHGYLQTIGRLD